MSTCETCHSWKPERGKSFGECTHPKIKHEGDPPIDGLAQAETLGTFPMIYTGPHFGCVQWRGKSEQKKGARA